LAVEKFTGVVAVVVEKVAAVVGGAWDEARLAYE
jgi:hypothetical protein